MLNRRLCEKKKRTTLALNPQTSERAAALQAAPHPPSPFTFPNPTRCLLYACSSSGSDFTPPQGRMYTFVAMGMPLNLQEPATV